MSYPSFKHYERSFRCDVLPRWNGYPIGTFRPAVAIAEQAAREFTVEAIEQAYVRLTNEAGPGFDELQHYLASPSYAAELLADALLYEDLRRNQEWSDARLLELGQRPPSEGGCLECRRNGSGACAP